MGMALPKRCPRWRSGTRFAAARAGWMLGHETSGLSQLVTKPLLWMYCPDRIEAREGQHIGVVATAFVYPFEVDSSGGRWRRPGVPPSAKMRLTSGITSRVRPRCDRAQSRSSAGPGPFLSFVPRSLGSVSRRWDLSLRTRLLAGLALLGASGRPRHDG